MDRTDTCVSGKDHYDGAGDGQCCAIKSSDDERCTNGVYGSDLCCGTHKRASDVTLAPEQDDREWRRCPECGWQRCEWGAAGDPPFCSWCSCEFPPSAERWQDTEVSQSGGDRDE